MVAVTAPGAMELKRMDVGIQTGQDDVPPEVRMASRYCPRYLLSGVFAPAGRLVPFIAFPGCRDHREAGPAGPCPVPPWVLACSWRNPSLV